MSEENKVGGTADLSAVAAQHDEARQEAAAQAAQHILEKLNQEAAPSSPEVSEAEARKAHEEAEARRKAEWEKKQKAREDNIQFAWEKAVDLPDKDLVDASVKRLGDMTERLTQRNMKICVTESIQTLCYEDLEFARLVMHPRKSMIHCFKYINRKALEYLKQAMKDTDEKPIAGNMIGGDVPDGLCYQWAEEYFRDMNAQEDKTEDDKAFVPKPYSGKPATKKKENKQPAEKKSAPKAASKPLHESKTVPEPAAMAADSAQISLF